MSDPYKWTGKASHDALRITFEFPQTMELTGPELESFIRDLAVLRAGLQPPVPMDPSLTTTPHSVVHADTWYVEPDPAAPTQLRLFLRHPGFGWLWLPLAARHVQAMQETMRKVLRGLPKLQ